ncbi:MAG: aminotransferase class V-fold PLP-dependent enzyme [Bacteroidota bacterium]
MENNSRRAFTKKALASLALPGIIPELLATPKINNQVSPDAEEYWQAIKNHFRFAPDLKYFNNASLGSCPEAVRKGTNEFRDLLDSFPSRYMWGGWKDEIEKTRQDVADLFSVSDEEIALIHNTTEGMNLVAQSMDFEDGDEIILADHEHTSGYIPFQVWQERKNVKLVRPTLPLMPSSKEEVVEAYRKAITPKTKMIVMCHIVNTNGMILPVKEVSALAHEKGILVAVDGAQSAGMFPINLDHLGCDYYTASAHKWLFAPKGIGVFYSRKSSQKHLKPLVVCRGFDDPSIRRLENYNTRNLPELLGLGVSINYVNEIGIDKIGKRSYELKAYFRSKLENDERFTLKSPVSDDLSSAIQVVEVSGKDVVTVKEQLFENAGIDCRPMTKFGLNAVRISLSIYITKADIDMLVDELKKTAA